MDKKKQDKKTAQRFPIHLSMSRQNAPNGETFYRADVLHRQTLGVDELTSRVAERSEFRVETFRYAYACLKEEIYEALQRGECVDLGFGMLSLSVKGRFGSLAEPFDPGKHVFNVSFTPSPRMVQLEESLRAGKTSGATVSYRRLVILDINSDSPDNRPADYLPARLRPGSRFVHITGRFLKIMGEHPDVGIRFFSEDGAQVVRPDSLLLNERSHVIAFLKDPLPAGHWIVEVATQYNSSYRFYKEPRTASFDFDVDE